MTTSPIVVTGATGFLASHTVKLLLEQNYKVHGTVRSLANKSKYEFLLQLPNAENNLRLFEGDLEKEGSFEDAIRGCEVVLHIASPFFFGEKDPQKELVDPAVNGTLNVLKSCLKFNEVRRVVVTSSCASIYDPKQLRKGKVFTEDDWNTESSLTYNAYWFSKVQAEKAAWDFMKNNKPHFDLVTLCPPFILGNVLTKVSSLEELNTSNAYIVKTLQAARKGEAIPNGGYGMVDVHDIAEMHIRAGTALKNPKVSNQRLIVCEGSYPFPDIVRKAIALFPEDFKGVNPNELKIDGDEQEGRDTKTIYVSNERLRQAFPDFKFIPFDTTLKNTIQNAKDLKLW